MTPETRAMIDRVRDLVQLMADEERKPAVVKVGRYEMASTKKLEDVRLAAMECFRTAAPAIADALEAAERDKAKLVKGVLGWWCPVCYCVTINANNEPMCGTCRGTGRHPAAMVVLRSIGIEDINAARAVAEGAE